MIRSAYEDARSLAQTENYMKQVCKFLAQLWKFDGTKLINKGNIWRSTDEWQLKRQVENFLNLQRHVVN